MKIITWNVNGLRSCLSKNTRGVKIDSGDVNALAELVREHDPDILCLQETRCPADLEVDLPFAFKKIIASQTKKGYSGVGVFSKIAPLKIHDDWPLNEEGRVIVLEFEKFVVINTYTPNSKPDLSRLEYRIDTWESGIRDYINKVVKKTKKHIIYVSDFNVAPTELDIYKVKGNEKSHGFTIEERGAFATLLTECELVDAFRVVHPDVHGKYSWFSNFGKSREKNNGWRIDTCVVSAGLARKVSACDILDKYYASDHLPVVTQITII